MAGGLWTGLTRELVGGAVFEMGWFIFFLKKKESNNNNIINI